jgi:hypothetical protein
MAPASSRFSLPPEVVPEDYYVVVVFEPVTPGGKYAIEMVLVEWIVWPNDDIEDFLAAT